MPHVKISKVLHLAADQHLWSGSGRHHSGVCYSCWAIENAIDQLIRPDARQAMKTRINTGLKELGLDIHGTYEFDEFQDDVERQSARFLWLKFVALLAEEQGV